MPSFFLHLLNFRSYKNGSRRRIRGFNGARNFASRLDLRVTPTTSSRRMPKKSSDSTKALGPVESSVPNRRSLRLHQLYHRITRTREVQLTCDDFEGWGVKRNRSPRKNQRLEAVCDGLTNPKAESAVTKSKPTYKKVKFKLPGEVSNKVEVAGSLLCDQAYKVGDEIEVLSQDSGLRGCWFRCKVLKVSPKGLKVQYVDLQNALDESANLEEWVLAPRVAAPDKLGIRCEGRLTVRPWPPQASSDHSIKIGAVVDAWWCNGWWEGVVLEVGSSEHDMILVYVPGEDRELTVRKEEARVSRDWINGTWVELEATFEQLCRIPSSISPDKRFSMLATLALGPGESSLPNNKYLQPLVTYHRKRKRPEVQWTYEELEKRFATSFRNKQSREAAHDGLANSMAGSSETKHKPACKKLEIMLPGGVSNNNDVVGSHLFGNVYKVGDRIELLSQDSGIRGCWFRCKVMEASAKRLKVQYVDLKTVGDEPANLEEWVPAARVAAPDKLGIRCEGRLTVRPWPPQISLDCLVKSGAVVDAWWCEGWWEGVVLEGGSSECDSIQVYFPGEDRVLTVLKENARVSRDWINGKWVDLEATSDNLCRIPSSVRGGEDVTIKEKCDVVMLQPIENPV